MVFIGSVYAGKTEIGHVISIGFLSIFVLREFMYLDGVGVWLLHPHVARVKAKAFYTTPE